MLDKRRFLLGTTILAGVGMLFLIPSPRVHGYVEAPHSLGQVVALASNILVIKVTAVDRVNNRIIFSKVRDLKGVHKPTEIRHNIGKAGFEPREWQTVMTWAEIGKEAIFLHNGSQSETCTGMYWYQTYGNANDGNAWWGMSHGEPYLLRSFAGRVDKLASAITDMLAGKEVVVPCMVNGNNNDLKAAKARIQRLRASLKLQNYDPKRDFVGWGGEDFRRVLGMPGFTHLSGVARVDPDAQSISSADFNGDGKPDLCLAGGSRVALLQYSADSLSETSLPGTTGSRSAVWADYNGDGAPDLLLAAAAGPRLYTNLGKGAFRDDSNLLPAEPAYNLTCAAWIDHDGDGRPDVLLGNGWHGLRLYRNKGKADGPAAFGIGNWQYAGPFPYNPGAFANSDVGVKDIDLKKKYPGKGEEVGWQDGSRFADGRVNSLAVFKDNTSAAVYLYREIRCKAATKLPVSLGSDDGLAVWCNGKQVLAQNVNRAAAPDQAKVTLDLKEGKNELLLKVTQTGGEWAFYFNPLEKLPALSGRWFEDVSDAAGLGEKGVGGAEKGDTLTVCDLDGDGKPDFLYGAGSGVVARNQGGKFVEVKDTGISYAAGKVGPVFGDFDADGRPDLFVPAPGGCRLFRNAGNVKFTDVTKAAKLDTLPPHTTSAAWGDVDNDGLPDLVVGCLHGPNRFRRNLGGGAFEDATEKIGLNGKVFNTQAVCLVDLNGDGALDVVFNNEGQDSAVLLGNPEFAGKKLTPVTLTLAAKLGVTGSRVSVRDPAGKLVGSHHVSGGDGRGGQAPPLARFALAPGKYRVEVLLSSGEKRGQELEVAGAPLRGVLDEKTPKVE